MAMKVFSTHPVSVVQAAPHAGVTLMLGAFAFWLHDHQFYLFSASRGPKNRQGPDWRFGESDPNQGLNDPLPSKPCHPHGDQYSPWSSTYRGKPATTWASCPSLEQDLAKWHRLAAMSPLVGMMRLVPSQSSLSLKMFSVLKATHVGREPSLASLTSPNKKRTERGKTICTLQQWAYSFSPVP